MGKLIQIICQDLFHPNFIRGVIKIKVLGDVICETWYIIYYRGVIKMPRAKTHEECRLESCCCCGAKVKPGKIQNIDKYIIQIEFIFI